MGKRTATATDELSAGGLASISASLVLAFSRYFGGSKRNDSFRSTVAAIHRGRSAMSLLGECLVDAMESPINVANSPFRVKDGASVPAAILLTRGGQTVCSRRRP